MLLVTPLRNGMTLAAQDPVVGVAEVYKRAFAQGRGWAGGHHIAVATAPGFLIRGPAYHLCSGSLGSLPALALTALAGNFILYPAEVKNAQIAYNRSLDDLPQGQRKKLQHVRAVGPGFGYRLVRDTISMAGLRTLGPYCEATLSQTFRMREARASLLGMIVANVFTGALSMPFHQLFQFAITTGAVERSMGRQSCAFAWLRRQYVLPTGRLSSAAGRDVFLKAVYNAVLFTLFSGVERACVAFWPESQAF